MQFLYHAWIVQTLERHCGTFYLCLSEKDIKSVRVLPRTSAILGMCADFTRAFFMQVNWEYQFGDRNIISNMKGYDMLK